MKLTYHEAAEHLRDFISVYYMFETTAPIVQPICAELGNVRFVLRGGGSLIWPDNRVRTVPPASIVGPTMSAYTIKAEANTRVFGVGVLPHGWDAIFGFGADQLTDELAPLGDCIRSDYPGFGGAAGIADLHDRIYKAQTLKDCAFVADSYFSALIAGRGRRLKPFPKALEDWLLSPERRSLDDLIADLGVSRRQTDRLAKYFFGASPKALQRKYRALHALTRMSLYGSSHWYDVSGEGYYDQSHFIKEFKTFVGITPNCFDGDTAILMARSIRLRARATHKHPLSML
ncbi:MAG: AraC family transcriptional regulator [Pseudomonadota bacterium]